MEEMDRYNMRALLAAFIEEFTLTARKVARAIGCSEATILRLLTAQTLPTDKMLAEVALMSRAGFDRYATLTKTERRQLARKMNITVVSGSVAGGFLVIPQLVDVLGKPGLSAAGVTSALDKMSRGNGMVRGVQVAAAIPIVVGAVGYVVLKGAEYFASERQLDVRDLNPEWEILNEAKA